MNYKKIEIEYVKHDTANINSIQFLESKIEQEIKRTFQNRSVVISLVLTCITSCTHTVTKIRSCKAQTSLDSELNPTDFYYEAVADWLPDCKGMASAGYGTPEKIQIDLKFDIGQRPLKDQQLPWPPMQNFYKIGSVRYFSFLKGMEGGYNWRSLYKLDYTDPENVKFDFIKDYCYVQGQVINYSDARL